MEIRRFKSELPKFYEESKFRQLIYAVPVRARQFNPACNMISEDASYEFTNSKIILFILGSLPFREKSYCGLRQHFLFDLCVGYRLITTFGANSFLEIRRSFTRASTGFGMKILGTYYYFYNPLHHTLG